MAFPLEISHIHSFHPSFCNNSTLKNDSKETCDNLKQPSISWLVLPKLQEDSNTDCSQFKSSVIIWIKCYQPPGSTILTPNHFNPRHHFFFKIWYYPSGTNVSCLTGPALLFTYGCTTTFLEDHWDPFVHMLRVTLSSPQSGVEVLF